MADFGFTGKQNSGLNLVVVILLVITGLAWLVFAIVTPIWAITNGKDTSLYGLIAVGDVINAALLLIAARLVFVRHRWAFWFAAVLLTINILLIIADQIGFVDISIMLFSITTFVLLILNRVEARAQANRSPVEL
jgi:hypothetical protein